MATYNSLEFPGGSTFERLSFPQGQYETMDTVCGQSGTVPSPCGKSGVSKWLVTLIGILLAIAVVSLIVSAINKSRKPKPSYNGNGNGSDCSWQLLQQQVNTGRASNVNGNGNGTDASNDQLAQQQAMAEAAYAAAMQHQQQQQQQRQAPQGRPGQPTAMGQLGPMGDMMNANLPAGSEPDAFQGPNTMNAMNLAEAFGDKPFMTGPSEGGNASGAAAASGSEGLVDGDEKLFSQIVDVQKQPCIVAFMMNGCGHCTKMRPDLERAAKRAVRNGRIPFMGIDMAKAGNLLERLQVKGFPTIVKIMGGKMTKYEGDRSENSLFDFADPQTQ